MNIFKRKHKTDWVEESFIFDNSVGRQIKSLPTTGYINSSADKKKLFIFSICVAAVLALFFCYIFYLQIVAGSKYRVLAENNRERIIPIQSERGVIYDRNLVPLTKNIPNFSLAIVPQDLPRLEKDREELIDKLAAITSGDRQVIHDTIEEYKSYRYESIIIAEDIPYDKAILILVQAADLPGIKIERGSKRLYSNFNTSTNVHDNTVVPESLSPVLGYLGKMNLEELKKLYSYGYVPSDSIGKTGVEKVYESDLRGTYGRKKIEVDASGKEQSVLSEEPPIPGNHVVLSIDSKVQSELYKIIQKHLRASNKHRASGVALNPNNGEILALVSLPSYNNNDFSGGINKDKYKSYINDENHPLFFRAIAGTFPSGSSVKPAIGAAALQENIIDSKTSFLSTGGLTVGAWKFPDWSPTGHGLTDIRKSLAWSVNTFYYYIGGGYNNFQGLGVEKLNSYLEKFGFGKKTGIDLPGEASGLIPTPDWKAKEIGEQWYIGDTYNLSIGQGYFLTTPLQVANMTAAIANGGKLYKPHVLKSLVSPVSKEVTEKEKEVINNQVVSEKNTSIVRLGMRDCVVSGSCHRLASLPFSSAGKTGTAQWNNNKETHAWFTSFAPFEKPEIVLTIMVEEGGEGGIIATPIAEEFYRWWWGYRNK